MNLNIRKLILEMGAIVVIPALFGIIWNHRMLYDVWLGKTAGAPAPSAVAEDKGYTPMPAGLAQVKELFDRGAAVFVDAREDLVFVQGHIRGAVPLSVGQFESRIADFTAKVPSTSTVVVYCSGYGCVDSMTVGRKLTARGYRQVLVFEGGYPEWKDAALPVEGGRL